MAIMEISVVPIGTPTPSVSQYVVEAAKIVQQEENVKFEVTAMGTIIEGDLEQLLSLAGKMHRSAFDGEVMRVLTSIRIDERHDKPSKMQEKVAAVQEEMEKVQNMGKLPG